MTTALRSLTAAALAFLLAAPIVAQTTPPAPPPCPPPPAFANPAGVSSKDGTLQAVMMLSDADRAVPNANATLPPCTTTQHLRYYMGWNPLTPNVTAPVSASTYAPGPTLRAKVGDKVEIMFLNAVNDANFSYTFVTANGKANPAYGCDEAANPAIYPAKDVFPNCFHGSSTANIHFHGTHTSPDGLGDNVLVQVLPDRNSSQKKWEPIFKKIFDSPTIPQTWAQMPVEYREEQERLVKAAGADLWATDKQQIDLGQWPQYLVGAFPNVFELPAYAGKDGKYKAGQAPGTHWYHAHKHGSTALHSLNGMAGAFIIEGDYDKFLRDYYKLGDTYGNFEKVFVFQLINANQNLLRTGVNFNKLGPGLLLLNGQLNPTLTMKAGEVQLWRMVNASTGSAFSGIGPGLIDGDLFTLAVGKGFQFRQTARDGVQFSPTNYQKQPFLNGLVPNGASFGGAATQAPPGLMLAGGNRSDILVKAPSPTADTTYQFTTNGGNLFSVLVKAADPKAPAMNFPTTWPNMPEYLNDLPQPTDYPHHVTFGWDAEPGRNTAGGVRLTSNVGNALPPKYTIDNRQFEEFGPLIDQCMPLNGLQEWVLENTTTIGHPFHIHINPFQITKIEAPFANPEGTGFVTTVYEPKDNFVWSDVITIPAGVQLANGQFMSGKVTIRQTYLDFTGTYVLHCHILAHEDRGMMQLVRVVPADKFPDRCQQAIPHHH